MFPAMIHKKPIYHIGERCLLSEYFLLIFSTKWIASRGCLLDGLAVVESEWKHIQSIKQIAPKRTLLAISSRSLLVAAIMRTSTALVSVPDSHDLMS
jgi:hypothetical protein